MLIPCGKFFSYSLVSTYKLTATEYSETLLFSILNDQIGGKDIVYDLSGKTQSVPVNMDGGRLQFKPPFDRPSLVFEGNKITATLQGGFGTCGKRFPKAQTGLWSVADAHSVCQDDANHAIRLDMVVRFLDVGKRLTRIGPEEDGSKSNGHP